MKNLILIMLMMACGPMVSYSLTFDTRPGSWYFVELTFGPDVPSFLKIKYSESQDTKYPEIANPTAEPFYILDKHKSQISMLKNSTLYYRDRLARIDPVKGIEWKVSTLGLDPTPLEYHSFYPIWLDQDYGIQLAQVKQDDRPANQVPPPPESFILLGLYKEKEIQLKGTITYKLNPTYDPKQGAKAKAHADEALKEWDKNEIEHQNKVLEKFRKEREAKQKAGAAVEPPSWYESELKRIENSKRMELASYIFSVILPILIAWLFLKLIRTIQMNIWNRRLLGFLWIGASVIYIPIHIRVLYYLLRIPSNTTGANIHNAALDGAGLVTLSVIMCVVILPLIFLNSRLRKFFFLNEPSKNTDYFAVIIIWILTLLYISPMQMSVYKKWVSSFPFY